MQHVSLDPVRIHADFAVHAGDVVLTATDAPTDDAGQEHRSRGFAHQRAASIALQSIQVEVVG